MVIEFILMPFFGVEGTLLQSPCDENAHYNLWPRERRKGKGKSMSLMPFKENYKGYEMDIFELQQNFQSKRFKI